MPFAVSFADRVAVLLEHPAVLRESSPTATSLSVQTQVNDALTRGETHYTDRPGILSLREKIAHSVRSRFELSIDAENDIIITCGVTEARFVAIQQVLQPDQILVAPSLCDRIHGAAVLRRASIQKEASPNASLVYLASSMPEEQLRSCLAATPKSALVLFEIDEPENCFHPSRMPGFEDRTITIGNLGEESWRVGYLASPGVFSPALRDFKQALTICSTNLSQWAALAFEELV